MEVVEDLKRVLWHELGHLCIGILFCEKNETYFNSSLEVSYFELAHKWGGKVSKNKIDKSKDLIQDIDNALLAIIDLGMGCVFQTLYINEILNKEESLSKCLCYQSGCPGADDIQKMGFIVVLLRENYVRKNISLLDFFNKCYELICGNKMFIKSIMNLVEKYSDFIIEEYNKQGKSREFKYIISDKELDELEEEVKTIILNNSFDSNVIIMKNLLNDVVFIE